MQKNLSSLKHLRLKLSDANSYHRDEDTDEKIIVIKKEGFGQQKKTKLTTNFSFSKH